MRHIDATVMAMPTAGRDAYLAHVLAADALLMKVDASRGAAA